MLKGVHFEISLVNKKFLGVISSLGRPWLPRIVFWIITERPDAAGRAGFPLPGGEVSGISC